MHACMHTSMKPVVKNVSLNQKHIVEKNSKKDSCVWRYMFHEKPQGRRARNRGPKPKSTYRMHANEAGYPNPTVGELDTLPMGETLIVLPNLGFDEHQRLSKDTILLL